MVVSYRIQFSFKMTTYSPDREHVLTTLPIAEMEPFASMAWKMVQEAKEKEASQSKL